MWFLGQRVITRQLNYWKADPPVIFFLEKLWITQQSKQCWFPSWLKSLNTCPYSKEIEFWHKDSLSWSFRKTSLSFQNVKFSTLLFFTALKLKVFPGLFTFGISCCLWINTKHNTGENFESLWSVTEERNLSWIDGQVRLPHEGQCSNCVGHVHFKL